MKLLKRPEVLDRIGIRSTKLYQMVRSGQFPKPVRLSSKAHAWPEHEIDEWIQARMAEREVQQ